MAPKRQFTGKLIILFKEFSVKYSKESCQHGFSSISMQRDYSTTDYW